MEDLFRFVALRPPQTADTTEAVALHADTPFQTALAAIRDAPVNVPVDSEATRPVPKADAMAAEARRLQSGFQPYNGRFIADPATMHAFHAQLARLRRELLASTSEIRPADLIARIAQIFDMKESDVPRLLQNADFNADTERLFDSIIALFLAPTELPYLLTPLSELAQTTRLVQRAAARDARLGSSAAVREALSASLLLPPQIFPIHKDQIQPVGVADLLVVKQQLKRHELGEVSTIENVLRGESRRRADKRTLTRDQTTIDETESTTETTNELTTADRFELKQESEETFKEELSVKAGVSVSAKYGVVQIDAKTDVAYSNAKSESSKLAQTQARDVTQRAASKVTERVKRQLTTRIIETFEQSDERTLDNTKGTENIAGVYQFVNKVYEAQVFNYGKRLLFDVMVPEPAAFLLDAGATQGSAAIPTAPPEFNVNPGAISADPNDPNYYGTLGKTFAATGLPEPPVPTQVVERSFSAKVDDPFHFTHHVDMQIPSGYLATAATVWLAFVTEGEPKEPEGDKPAPQGLSVAVGGKACTIANLRKSDVNPQRLTFDSPGIVSVAIAIIGYLVRSYVVQVDLHCVREPSSFTAWQIKVHGALQAAHAQQVKDHEDRLAALAFQPRAAGSLGSDNPDKNRELERIELKKSCIALLGRVDLLGFDAIDDSPPGPPPPAQRFPRPASVDTVQAQGRIIRFFEQAFEWEQMTYVFYPYFWSRKETWYDRVQKDVDDPTFGQFLRSGSARVVVPVRPGFEADLRYFLLTGQLWGGAELPNLSDPTYLPITQEIKELSGAPGDEVPQGQPWEVKIPSSLIKLRPDGKLPRWERVSPDNWIWRPVPKDDV